jgi:hypothetical protein
MATNTLQLLDKLRTEADAYKWRLLLLGFGRWAALGGACSCRRVDANPEVCTIRAFLGLSDDRRIATIRCSGDARIWRHAGASHVMCLGRVEDCSGQSWRPA